VARAAKDPVTGLTHKQESFCVFYVTGPDGVSGNASECVRQAFNYKKAKASTIQRKAKELLNIATIQARIAVLRRGVAERAEITGADVLRETFKLAFSDLRGVFTSEGALKDPSEWPDDIAAAISGVDVFEEFQGQGEKRTLIGYTKKVRTWDKNSSLDRLFKHFGLFKKDNEQVTDPIRQLLAAINARSESTSLVKP